MPTIRHRITLPGVGPIQTAKPGYEYFYLYGAIEPDTGQRFFTEHERLNSNCFQDFLDRFSKAFAQSQNVMILDNGQFHKANALSVPSNVELTFLPPYSPELNPVERLWQDPLAGWPSTSTSTYRACDKRPGWLFVVTPIERSLP